MDYFGLPVDKCARVGYSRAMTQDMRYFIEVTEAEAQYFEDTGFAKVALGASGNGARPWFHGPDIAWMLMKSMDLRAMRKAEEEDAK